MVVPRYSTTGLVVRYVVRQLMSCATFYLLLRIIGVEPLERGPVYIAAMVIAFMLFGVDRLISDLMANGETKRTLAEAGDLQSLPLKLQQREIRAAKIHAVLGFLVGLAMIGGEVDFLEVDIPNWIGPMFMLLAIVLFVFARRFAVPRSVESMVTNVLPPGFSKPK